MSSILIVEDDDAIRANIARLLQLEGHAVLVAADGVQALAQARQAAPDVVISDIGMPGLDGFALLQALRAEPALATTPVLLLTALDDRASMRRGMTLGADDYLAKPFTRTELLEALGGLLRKRERVAQGIAAALREREERLRHVFADMLGGAAAPRRLEPPAGSLRDHALEATVVFAVIRDFTSLADKLDSAELAELLTALGGAACERLQAHGARHLKFMGAGLVAVFAAETLGVAARRALAAALAVTLAGHALRGWLQRRFPGRGLPPFAFGLGAFGLGLHAGAVEIWRPSSSESRESTPLGPTVDAALGLALASRELGWTVTASSDVLAAAGPAAQTGGMTSLDVQGSYLDAAEITGLAAVAGEPVDGLATLSDRAGELQAAVQVNSELTARAFKGALQSKLSALKGHSFQPDEAPLRLKGYRLQRKIGAGGMTEVYLAAREADGLPLVLKVLDAAGRATSEHLSRFIQEYTLLSQVAHPRVVRIYDQGFTDDHAYIAMEYFERGDLRGELRAGPMALPRVLEVLAQVAQALEAIHARGIIHRDLKPENIMLRADGGVALGDFGVAKSMLQADHLALAQTRHGDVVGTPYYLSPEQAAGARITPATDLYSLGVMLYEMLAGERPFQGDSLEELLARHVTAPTPQLPAEHAQLQPLLERLMAKDPATRHGSARALLDDLAQRALLRTLADAA